MAAKRWLDGFSRLLKAKTGSARLRRVWSPGFLELVSPYRGEVFPLARKIHVLDHWGGGRMALDGSALLSHSSHLSGW